MTGLYIKNNTGLEWEIKHGIVENLKWLSSQGLARRCSEKKVFLKI